MLITELFQFFDIKESLNEYFKFRRMPPTVDSDARDVEYDSNANIHAAKYPDGTVYTLKGKCSRANVVLEMLL